MDAIENAAGVQAGKNIAIPLSAANRMKLSDRVRTSIDDAIEQMLKRSQELASIRSSAGKRT